MSKEDIIYKSFANLQKNVETIGGTLTLHQDRLVFLPHKLNIQKKALIINLADIKYVETGWTKFLGLIPIIPNAVLITTVTSNLYRITVFNKKIWIKKIMQSKSKDQSD